MSGTLEYSFRPHALSHERKYRLHRDCLEYGEPWRRARVAYAEVQAIKWRRYNVGSALSATTKRMYRCILYCRTGRRIVLSPLHHVRFGVIENRSDSFNNFIRELHERIRLANPLVKLTAERAWSSRVFVRLERTGGPIVVRLLRIMRHFDLDRTGDIMALLMRAITPLLRSHHTARANLSAAYPEKSEAEINKVLVGMWDNIARFPAEYAHLDRFRNDDTRPTGQNRIDIDSISRERLSRLRDDEKPAIVFSAHLSNFELAGVVSSAFGLDLAALHRPLHNRAIADEIARIRARAIPTLTHPIRAEFGAAIAMNDALLRGMHVGLLVDQYFAGGVDVIFFGRSCKVSPALAKLARRVECRIHGARMIRLAKSQFRYELTDAIDPPRDAAGKIDVAATMQTVTSIVEGWVREHPEQWIWAHRRWR